MTLWQDLGFRANIYATTPVPPTAEGAQLLVGRDRALRSLTVSLMAGGNHPTIEGDNGIGKTSLVSVAGFNIQKRYLEDGSGQLLIPLADPFQLTSDQNIADFEKRVYFSVAQALIQNREMLRQLGRGVSGTNTLESWLNDPSYRQGGISGTVMGTGGGGSFGSAPNTSEGFAEAGFKHEVDAALHEAFPDHSAGAVLAVIDNLELLQTSQAARRQLEALRDSALAIHGVSWVLCGARGIVRSAASSPRLDGVLASPIQLGPIDADDVGDVVARRIEAYRGSDDAMAPVDSRGFTHIYRILHGNLRNSLKFSADFTVWAIGDEVHLPEDPQERFTLLETYIGETASDYETDAKRGLTRRSWEVFDHLVDMGGTCSPSQYAEFGFNSPEAMRPSIKALEEGGIVQSSVDETDQRRRTISISAKGWLVHYHRAGYPGA